MNPYFGFFFATTTLIIAIPTAIKVYNWVLTLWRGDIHLTVPMLFAIALHVHVHQRRADRPVPRQRHRRHAAVRTRCFVVAHFHMVMARVADPGRLRRDLPLVPEDHRPHAQRHDGHSSTSGSRSSAPTPIYSPMHYLGLPRRAAPLLTRSATPYFIPAVGADAERRRSRSRRWSSAPSRCCSCTTWSGADSNGQPAGEQPVARDDARMADARHAAEARQLRGPAAARRLSLGVRLQRAGRAGGLHSAEPAARQAGAGGLENRRCAPSSVA